MRIESTSTIKINNNKKHIGSRFESIEKYVAAKKNLSVIDNIIDKHR